MRERTSAMVLLVDDDPDLRALLAAALDAQGIDVLTARNGMEAFALACIHHPALIVLDLGMPVMSGEEFRRVQRTADDIQGIPVLVLSARDDAARIAEQLDAAACLEKPVDPDHFVSCVKSLAPGLWNDSPSRVA
jgi:DNA-binding response OmpR family regulator